ncbi:hypothetical protein SGH10_005421 (plasmid) [Klebsiella pneumoniae]|uniref:Uncharacterized protein n=3 Tax=Enterobacteriaceae TaxID=543 RepID=A0A7G3NPL2_ECOLX|nr:hypothetical protein pPUTH1_0072 [Klebsiella pneumoniae]EJK88605.1 hypothetical protein UUU_27060 [Klebsiella pneumoniae subsp. pneumoniae DSM 30104 = JCM 1662 = NBRC 14940]QGF03340.1 hypothetical protein pVir-SCNJ1-95 [Klebsiella pneumoniae subsp. pneumoniae]QGW59951.1 hypothetical protein HPPIBGPI_00171 [Escherichia coli]AUB50720.1 hypothetical protein SGH10_005421 [Klebsiella pneumoniae]
MPGTFLVKKYRETASAIETLTMHCRKKRFQRINFAFND